MGKTLKTIQTFSKVGKTIANIVFVFSIIGAVFCTLALAVFAGMQDMEFEGTTIVGLIEETGTNFVTTVFECVASAISCIASAVIAKFAANYFTNELDDGTPFTYAGAKELLRLGIISVAIPAAISIILGIAFTVTKLFWPMLSDTAISENSFSIGVGLITIVMSFVCKHGAEVVEKYQSENSYIKKTISIEIAFFILFFYITSTNSYS